MSELRFTNSLDTSTRPSFRQNNVAFEAVVGSAVSFDSVPPSTLALTPSVVSAPVGSVATFDGQSFTCDTPGAYVFSFARTDLVAFTVKVRAFPASAWTHTAISRLTTRDRALILRNIANEPAISDAAFAAATTAEPFPAGSQGMIQSATVGV